MQGRTSCRQLLSVRAGEEGERRGNWALLGLGLHFKASKFERLGEFERYFGGISEEDKKNAMVLGWQSSIGE